MIETRQKGIRDFLKSDQQYLFSGLLVSSNSALLEIENAKKKAIELGWDLFEVNSYQSFYDIFNLRMKKSHKVIYVFDLESRNNDDRPLKSLYELSDIIVVAAQSVWSKRNESMFRILFPVNSPVIEIREEWRDEDVVIEDRLTTGCSDNLAAGHAFLFNDKNSNK